MSIRSAITLLLLGTLSFNLHAHGNKHESPAILKGTESAAAKVVLSFHQALKSGDQQQARALLADDVTIYEGGSVERSAGEYAAHHMAADMAYLANMQVTTLENQVSINGETAISIARSHTKGTYKGKERDHQGMETIVLQLQGGQWKIKHIHWS